LHRVLPQAARQDRLEIEGREETFTYDNYSWTEHMGRKWGQWLADPGELLEQLAACGFEIELPEKKSTE
jgi:hypothetical protein